MAAHLGFFELYNLKWDSFAWPCLDWSAFHKTLNKKYWSSILFGRPRYHFRVIFYLTCQNVLCAERISKKSNVAKYAPNGELTTPALSDDTRLILREKTINCTWMLQKPKWRTYWAQIRLIVTIYGENVSLLEADWSVVKVSHVASFAVNTRI